MNKFPLWLPKGSVRAILVMILALPIPILLVRYGFYHEEIPQSVKEVILVLSGLIIQIIKEYFASRDSDSSTGDKTAPVQ